MRTTTKKSRLVKFAVAGVTAAALTFAGATTASAEDQHSGGTPPTNTSTDPGARVLGETLRQQPQAAPAALPITGSDLVGLAALGLGAVAVGSTVVVGSRRRAVRATA
ncbi:MAG: LPXTG cell wall anchor domain-containing protein [Microthrixaceae bacterium]